MHVRKPARCEFGLKSAVVAAAALLFDSSLTARAQPYYTWADAVSPVPADADDPAFTVGGHLVVGNEATGSFSALAGATLTADQLAIGTGGTGGGTMSVTGPATQVNLVGDLAGAARLDVGSWGTGTLTVSSGAVLDAATAACTGGCSAFVGNSAGSTGTLEISGAGSEVRTLRLTVGQTSVFTTDGSGFDFGTPGGTTNATVNVTNGGVLRTQSAIVANNNAGPDGNGLEKANGTVLIDGAGSQWIITHDTQNNQAAFLSIGSGDGANGLVTVSGGGKVLVDGTGGPGPNDFISIGGTSKGKLTVTGAGSEVSTAGNNHVINVGANNSFGDGTFEILAGATASTLYMNIGRNGGTGTMLIDGAGSTLTQSGVGTNQSPGSNGPAFTNIGRNQGPGGGTGSVTVSNGGQWLISDGGGDGRTAEGGPGMIIGRGADSAGTLTITGAGSKVEIISNSLNPGVGVGDNYNPFFAVGYDNASTTSGTLVVSAGGKLVMTGNAVSAPGLARATALNIGGYSDTIAGGTGTATVTGSGSEIRVQGSDAFIAVGRSGQGTLNVTEGGKVVVTGGGINVGRASTGQGTLNVDSSTLDISGQFTSSNIGAFLVMGVGGGSGTANIGNGSVVTIANPGTAGTNLYLGGSELSPGGHGELNLSGGSRIDLAAGPGLATVSVGHNGTGLAQLSGGSSINVGDGNFFIGRRAGSQGELRLSGSSTINAGFVGLGVESAGTGKTLGTPGGTGTLDLGEAGSEGTIVAPRFELGAGSTLTGSGTIDAGPTGEVVIGGTIAPGKSPGRIRIYCDVTMLFGSQLILEVDGTGGELQIDQLVIGNDSTFDLTQLQIVFAFVGGTNPNDISLDLNEFLRTSDPNSEGTGEASLASLFGEGQEWGNVVDSSLFAFQSSAFDVTGYRFNPTTGRITGITASPVPEPATFALVLAALVLMARVRRRASARR